MACLTGALLSGCLLAAAAPADAAVFQSAQIRKIVEGKEVYINGKTAKVKDTARSGQQLRTGRSRVELLFDNKSIGFLGRSSVITVGSQCMKLDRGAVLVSGPQKTCLGTKVLGVTGTTTIVSKDANNDAYNVITLEGTAYVGDPDGFEENLKIKPPEPSQSSTPGTPEVRPGDPSGRTTYICGCEVAQFSANGEFNRQAVLSRSQLLAAVNRFTSSDLQLPPEVSQRIQQSISRCQ
ncbi:hypothetical protein [Synechococcus sp. GFB01]|uniref:hypothetical protein n=1 Tax=Synechococcus sp. GFB01 TaxID=1662190 RepID=UPI00064E370E|nr:hypothetical protein [Synechococcus sp. GFB01]KMM17345.1 hypothetical protein SYNGFB01_04675 [Synechococcus sp. GFB01]